MMTFGQLDPYHLNIKFVWEGGGEMKGDKTKRTKKFRGKWFLE